MSNPQKSKKKAKGRIDETVIDSPEKTIQFGDKTLKFGRYYHLKISVNDLKLK